MCDVIWEAESMAFSNKENNAVMLPTTALGAPNLTNSFFYCMKDKMLMKRGETHNIQDRIYERKLPTKLDAGRNTAQSRPVLCASALSGTQTF